ncbi:MAG: hypothetical protein DRI57_26320 [Deltaproteobacteria bacterium]|nr:MAG: hypothetical protein DRI57_26320 [Deltaproteobacteria bacterium]
MNTNHAMPADDFSKFQNLPQFFCQMKNCQMKNAYEQKSVLPDDISASFDTVLDLSDQAGEVVLFFLNRFDLTLPENRPYREAAKKLVDFMDPFLIKMKEMLDSSSDIPDNAIGRYDAVFDKWDEIIENFFFLTDEQVKNSLEQLSESTRQAVPMLPDWKDKEILL